MSQVRASDGRLFGVGLGPGDPELVTVKAAKIIASSPVIAYFAKKGANGRARAILDRWLAGTCQQVPLIYPVTTEMHFCDPAYVAELRGFYAHAEQVIAAHLLGGRDVALVCEGDPLFYGSFMHLYVRLKDRFCIEIIPGVSGMSGCWSAAKAPIAWGDDVLSVLPGTLGHAALVRHLCTSDAVVVIKVGANLAKIRAAIAEAGRLEAAIYVEHGTSEAQSIIPLAEKTDGHAPYFSSILIPGRGRRP
ncbi:MAG: precorrin-2 C(20)-methyltransferase [Beijerinckiaceae bacterium]|nr:precorrin-2 C(20)-methyltransferase [Beijerinckiaceae bacterium]MCI0736774.1 precorrin-2 C(20)-methyltransferase [Beijerinckiaceae bacterium]